MTRILHVVGARPNFMKIAPIMDEMAKHPAEFEQLLVHTGQHYDKNMSQIFFDDLGLPRPDVLISCTNNCSQLVKWFEYYERELGVPHLVLDVPFCYEEQRERDREYVEAQLHALVGEHLKKYGAEDATVDLWTKGGEAGEGTWAIDY